MSVLKSVRFLLLASVIGLSLISVLIINKSNAQEKGFSLQVTPSPLIATVIPGQTTELELKIRNTNIEPETLEMGLRSFSIDNESGEIELADEIDPGVEKFVSFSSPVFTVEAGEWFTQKLIIAVPEDSGFSYSFATTITREKQAEAEQGSSSIEGSVAVFTLLSVDRPGAVRSFDITNFSTDKKVYEYLPVNFSIKIRNTGNTIVQPKGNIFIQRNTEDLNPISTLNLNSEGGYIIPDSERTYSVIWEDGFPKFEDKPNSEEKVLRWNFADTSKFRIGKYTAKLVAIYDDGERDVPVIGEVSFWIIPWKQIVIFIIALLLMATGAFYVIRGLLRSIKKKTNQQ